MSEAGRGEARDAKGKRTPGLLGRMELERENEQLRQRVEQLTTLHNIGRLLTSDLELDRVLTHVVEAAVFITKAEEGALMLLDERTNELYVRAQKGLGEKYARGLRIKVEDSIAGETVKTGEPRRLTSRDRVLKVVTGYIVNSILYVPMILKDRVIGVLSVDNRTPDRPFTEDDEQLLSILADYAAIAIENARRTQVLTSLHETGRSMLSAPASALDEVLNQIAKSALEVLGADIVVLYEYDKRKDDVTVPPIIQGAVREPEVLRERGKVIRHEQPIIFKMIRRRQPFYAQDAGVDWAEAGLTSPPEKTKRQTFIAREGIVSSAGIPLIAGDETVGIMFVNYRISHPFADGEREIIELFANQAAIAIQNARLFGTAQRHTQELGALYYVSLDITRQLEVKPLLQTIIQWAADLLGANGGGLLLCHPKREDIEMIAAYRLPVLLGWKFGLGQGLVGRVAQSGKPMIVNDYHAWDDRDQRFDEEPYKRLFEAMVGVPLKRGKEVIGILAVSDTDGDRVFGDSDVRLLERFAAQAAIAIDNARTVSYLEGLVSSSPNAIVAVDQKGLITHFNEASERIMGYKREEVLGQSVIPFYCGGLEEAKKINSMLIEEDEKGHPVRNYETFVRGKDGEEIPVRFSGALLRYADGTRMGSIGIITDMREIRLLGERYHALYEVGKAAVEIPESDMRRICQEIMDVVTERVLHFKASYVRLLNEDGDLEIMAAGGVAEEYERPKSILKRGEGVTGQILDIKESLYVRNVQNEEKFKYAEWAKRNDVRSYLGVPLIVKGEVIGAITVYTGEEYEFSEGEIAFLERFASLAALVIDKAQEVSRTKKIAEILREVMPNVVELSGEGIFGDLWAKLEEIVSRMIPNTNLCLYVCDDEDPNIARRVKCNSETLSSRLKPTWYVGEDPFKPGVSIDVEACLRLEARSPQGRLEGVLVLEKSPIRDGVAERFDEIDHLVLTTLVPAVGNALFRQRMGEIREAWVQRR